MKRYRISTLLFLTLLAAVAFAIFRPFEPTLMIFEMIDKNRRHSYYEYLKQYEMTVGNMGGTDVWLPDNNVPYFDDSNHGLFCSIDSLKARIVMDGSNLVMVAPGRGLTYTVYRSEFLQAADLLVYVCDWRGRNVLIGKPLLFPDATMPDE